MPKFRSHILIAIMAFAATALGQNQKSIQLLPDNAVSQLDPDTGADIARRNCAVCHSTDYIVLQPHLDAQHWAAEVNKMRTVFGARINDADAKTISDYLGKRYGPNASNAGKVSAKP